MNLKNEDNIKKSNNAQGDVRIGNSWYTLYAT